MVQNPSLDPQSLSPTSNMLLMITEPASNPHQLHDNLLAKASTMVLRQ
jgi:hypothetical protein